MLRDILIKLASTIINNEVEISKAAAKQILGDELSPASLQLRALPVLFTDMVYAWEPESIWLGLADYKIDATPIQRDKIQAALTLAMNPAFYRDAGIFENTCLAFNDTPVFASLIQEATPAQMCWGCYEAELIAQRAGMIHLEFDYEPAEYAALSIYRSGLVLAPDLLTFCQDELDKLSRSDRKETENLKASVAHALAEVQSKPSVDDHELTESDIDIQVGRLLAIHLYIEDRVKNYNKFLDIIAKG